jgi:hypothetical protein
MKRLSKTKATLITFLAVYFLPVYNTILAQGVKINDLSGLESEVEKSSDSVVSMVKYVFGALFILSALFVAWEIANNKNNAKEHAIAWVVALVFYFIVIFVV